MTVSTAMKFITFVFLVVLFLNGCGSSPTSEAKRETLQEATVDSDISTQDKRSSQDFIQKADASTGNDEQMRAMYITALKYAIAEQRSEEYLLAIIERIDSTKYNSVALDITLANGLLFAARYDETLNQDAEVVMNRLNQGNVHRKHQVALWILKAQLESNQKQHIQVVKTVFRIEDLHQNQLTEQDNILLNDLLWRHLLHVSGETLTQFQNDFGQSSGGWISLAKIIKQYLSDAYELPRQLAIWQRMFPQHATSNYLPTDIKTLLTISPFTPNHIALLLPLSGKLQRQAESIRNGFIAAMDLNANTALTIIDTDKYELAEIEQKILTANVDFIVGPLVKEDVETIMHSELLAHIPSLHLNAPDFTPLLPQRTNAYYFALAPEDEIEQAIEFFLANKIKHPTLIYADNSLGRRLALHFNQLWLQATEREAESIAFKNKSKLGEAVEELLDVNLSKKRIAEMKRLFGTALETASRSRTDIDAVYIIANSQQTRLIKPFFDVNVSVFGEKLPIFGSSRSYLVDESKSQKRDLNDLTFTEMPWLIRNKARSLHNLYAKVGEQQTQLKKLFAFGFDAQRLIFALKQLETLTDQSFDGLTGQLAITKNNRIKRDLEWSRYQQGRIIAVAKTDQ
ncbi:penicillin-binding protein activator [Psychrosphaera sp. B3R10]|nr:MULTISPECIES: penicillin-binding protein activator [unclassified Psychrosphaera]MBU2882425.1 penicillin-binding protein activator [Psychrosphaera sp. I2R16]MBU2990246.1 penicillin-binding protein activator [Psychrosphaera sp. B3R10]